MFGWHVRTETNTISGKVEPFAGAMTYLANDSEPDGVSPGFLTGAMIKSDVVGELSWRMIGLKPDPDRPEYDSNDRHAAYPKARLLKWEGTNPMGTVLNISDPGEAHVLVSLGKPGGGSTPYSLGMLNNERLIFVNEPYDANDDDALPSEDYATWARTLSAPRSYPGDGVIPSLVIETGLTPFVHEFGEVGILRLQINGAAVSAYTINNDQGAIDVFASAYHGNAEYFYAAFPAPFWPIPPHSDPQLLGNLIVVPGVLEVSTFFRNGGRLRVDAYSEIRFPDTFGIINVEGGSIEGNGKIRGSVTLDGGTFSPGGRTSNASSETPWDTDRATGALTVDGEVKFGSGSVYRWEASEIMGDGGTVGDDGRIARTRDMIDATRISINATPEAPMFVGVASLATPEQSGPIGDFDPLTGFAVAVATTQEGITGDLAGVIPDVSEFQNGTLGGRFSLQVSGNDLQLRFSPVTELVGHRAWINDQGGSFAAGANWLGTQVPNSTATAVFDLASDGYDVTLNGNLGLGATEVGSDVVNVLLNGRTWSQTGSLSLGVMGGQHSELSFRGTGGVNLGDLSVGQAHRTEADLAIHDVSQTQVSGDAVVGGFGAGTLSLHGDYRLTSINGDLTLGEESCGSGGVLLPDGGYLNVSGETRVGYRGVGRMAMAGYVGVDTQSMILGHESGSSGTVSVSGNHAEVDSTELIVGRKGDGSLVIEVDADVYSERASIGAIEGSTGLVTVDDGFLRVYDDFYVGGTWDSADGGQGRLDVRNGGVVVVDSVLDLGPEGIVDVTGGGRVAVSTSGFQSTRDTLRVFDGTLAGDGTVIGDVRIGPTGTLDLHSTPGALTVLGDMEFYKNDLLIEIAGSPESGLFDVLEVTGTTSLYRGSVTFDFTSFMPSVGDTYKFLECDTIVNSFDSYSALGIDPAWLDYDLRSGSFVVNAVVPEPATITLLLSLAIAAVVCRVLRRRKPAEKQTLVA